jgi:uncharacterized protein YbaR (Trm112 family)
MGLCYLCEKKERVAYWSYFCNDCRRIKHLLNLYGDRVNDVLEHVLVRPEDKQAHKIKDEIKKDIELKTYSLRSKKN